MLEHSQRRTYKFISTLLVVLIVLQGVFVTFNVARADTAAMDPSGSKAGWDFTKGPTEAAVSAPTDPTAKANGGSTTTQSSTAEGCANWGWVTSPFTCVAASILTGIRDMFGWLATGAAALFVWVVDPANITGPTGMLNKVSVYNLWKFIRDFFNLFFILILLFSAFATIFQIEAFSIRRVFFNILLAALIINFSFPITRLLIDMTNVPMYYFINTTVEGTSSGALQITESLLGASGTPGIWLSNPPQFGLLLLNVIFTFLFAISLLVLAVLMLIRVIALVLLVIFSPIGFAASLLPGTEKLGRDWWNYFWKYAFFGPSAALMLMISVRFLNEVAKDGTFATMIKTNTQMSAGSFQSGALAQITFFTIPIILIWTAIGMANSASIAGAGKVTGWGYGAARKVGRYVGGKVTGYDFVKNSYTTWRKQREAAKSDAHDRQWSTRLGKWAAGKQNQVVANSGFTKAQRSDAQARVDSEAAKKTKEAAEKISELGVAELERISQTGDKYQKAAAAQKLIEKSALDMSNVAHAGLVASLKTTFGETSTVFRQMNNKLRQYDPVAAFNNISKNADGTQMTAQQRQARLREYINTNEFDVKKLGTHSLGDPSFMRMMLEEESISKKEIEDLRGKSSAHKKAVVDALNNIVVTANDANNPMHMRVQEAHFAQTGGIVTDAAGNEQVNNEILNNAAIRRHIFTRMDKDSAKRLDVRLAQNGALVSDMMNAVNAGKYKNMILGIDNAVAQAELNWLVKNMPNVNNPNAQNVQRMAQNDRELQNIG